MRKLVTDMNFENFDGLVLWVDKNRVKDVCKHCLKRHVYWKFQCMEDYVDEFIEKRMDKLIKYQNDNVLFYGKVYPDSCLDTLAWDKIVYNYSRRVAYRGSKNKPVKKDVKVEGLKDFNIVLNVGGNKGKLFDSLQQNVNRIVCEINIKL